MGVHLGFGEEIVVIDRPLALAAHFPGDGQQHPGDDAAPVADDIGQPVDVGHDADRGLDLGDEEILHVDDDQRRAGRIETVEHFQLAALGHDAVDNVLRHFQIVRHGSPPR